MRSNHLKDWLIPIRLAQIAHKMCEAHFANLHNKIGIPLVIFTTIVTGSIFSSLTKSPETWIIILTGVISSITAILSGVQTFFNYSSRSDQHRISGAKYGMLRHQIEHLQRNYDKGSDIYKEMASEFIEEWHKTDKDSPTIPQRIHNEAQKMLTENLAREKQEETFQNPKPQLLHTENTPKLVLIRGLPGSGKSTLAKAMKDYVHLEADFFFEKDGKFNFDRSKLPDAHAWCLKETKQSLRNGKSVVVANTFTRNVEMKPYVDLGFPTKIIEATGNWVSIHGVPVEHVELMREKWEKVNLENTSYETEG